LSVVGGLLASASTYHLFGRHLSPRAAAVDESLPHTQAERARGVLEVINRAGAEAFKIAVGAIPMLVLSLVAVAFLRGLGAIDWLTAQLSPLLLRFDVDAALILPTLTKYLAGGTAMMGVMDTLSRAGAVGVPLINASAGWLIHPFDLPGVAVLISAGPRVASLWRAAVPGACLGIALRTVAHGLLA
jgi:hypothetical protein